LILSIVQAKCIAFTHFFFYSNLFRTVLTIHNKNIPYLELHRKVFEDILY